MEPKQVGPSGGLERTPAFERSTSSESREHSNESVDKQSIESWQENKSEIGSVQAEARQVAMPALPTAIIPDDATGSSSTAADDVSLIARDDDLIEKEWVDKAKQILASTKDDPYTREREIGKLQAEYIRKRYGREIGSVPENE